MAAAQTCRGAYTVPPSPPPPSRVRAKTFRRAAKYLMETWRGGGGFFFFYFIDRPDIFVAPLIPASAVQRGRRSI